MADALDQLFSQMKTAAPPPSGDALDRLLSGMKQQPSYPPLPDILKKNQAVSGSWEPGDELTEDEPEYIRRGLSLYDTVEEGKAAQEYNRQLDAAKRGSPSALPSAGQPSRVSGVQPSASTAPEQGQLTLGDAQQGNLTLAGGNAPAKPTTQSQGQPRILLPEELPQPKASMVTPFVQKPGTQTFVGPHGSSITMPPEETDKERVARFLTTPVLGIGDAAKELDNILTAGGPLFKAQKAIVDTVAGTATPAGAAAMLAGGALGAAAASQSAQVAAAGKAANTALSVYFAGQAGKQVLEHLPAAADAASRGDYWDALGETGAAGVSGFMSTLSLMHAHGEISDIEALAAAKKALQSNLNAQESARVAEEARQQARDRVRRPKLPAPGETATPTPGEPGTQPPPTPAETGIQPPAEAAQPPVTPAEPETPAKPTETPGATAPETQIGPIQKGQVFETEEGTYTVKNVSTKGKSLVIEHQSPQGNKRILTMPASKFQEQLSSKIPPAAGEPTPAQPSQLPAASSPLPVNPPATPEGAQGTGSQEVAPQTPPVESAATPSQGDALDQMLAGMKAEEKAPAAIEAPVEATQNQPEEVEKTPAAIHKFSSTQANLPPELSAEIRGFASTIPPEEQSEKSGEGEEQPHITVRYGNPGIDPVPIAKALEDEGPITATLGKASLFHTEDGDVLKVDVDSPDLRRLNAKVGAAVEHTGETFPDYKPHVTIAYLKPGEGAKYDGKAIPGVTGQQVTLPSVMFSGKDGKQVEIPLTGKQKEGNAITSAAAPQAPVVPAEQGLAARPQTNQSFKVAMNDVLSKFPNATFASTGTVEEPLLIQSDGRDVGLLMPYRRAQAPSAIQALIERAKELLAGETGTSMVGPRLVDFAGWLKQKFGEDGPKANYSGFGAIQDRYLRNLSQLEKASKLAHAAALRAASSRAQSATILRAAVPRITETLKGSGFTWPELRLALIESRLRGTQERWQNFAEQASKISDDELKQAFGEQFVGLLEAMEGKKDLPQNIAETAAALMNEQDYDLVREFLADSFHDAAKSVTHVMEPAHFDAVTGNAKVKDALKVYKTLVEKPMAQNHALNEGVFSDALGPLDTYYPLIPLDREQPQGAGRRLPYHKPRNIANAFATGMSPEYDSSMEAFRDRVAGAVRANDKAALMEALQKAGLLRDLRPQDDPNIFVDSYGQQYQGEKVERSAARTIIKDGKVIHAPARMSVVPKWLARELSPILERARIKDESLVDRIIRKANIFALSGPADFVFHTSNLFGTLIANTPFLENSAGGKLMSAPLLKKFYAVGRVLGTDPTTPEAARDLIEMAKLGLVPDRYASETFSTKAAEELGAERKSWSLGTFPEHFPIVGGKEAFIPKGFGPALYGAKGVDVRARLVMYRLAKNLNPAATPQELFHFVNQLGNYVPALQGEIERALKRSGWSPFFTAGSTMIRNGINAWTGAGPMPKGGASMRLWQQLTGGALGLLALWAVAYQMYTGKWPWHDKRAKLLQIPANPSDRRSVLGNAMWGKGPETGYFNFSFFNPLVLRGARAFGLPGYFETRRLGGSQAQAEEAAERDVLNSLAHPALGPAARAAFVGLGRVEPYLTSFRDNRGRVAPQFFPAVPPKTKAGLPTMEKRAMFATKELNAFWGNSGAALGLFGELPNEKGNQGIRMIVDLTMPGLVGSASNPYHKSALVLEQKQAMQGMR